MQTLPQTRVVVAEPPEVRKGECVEFRLTYQGRLPSASQNDKRTKDKQRIRRVMHPQLRALWRSHPALQSPALHGAIPITAGALAENYSRFGFRFVPLICPELVDTCGIDILFLRRDGPGSLVKHGGDIDNRLKVFFDGLRMPESLDEANNEQPTAAENPFFVLLQDDRLITELSVTTDRLLTPMLEGEAENDVHLVIHVKTFGATRGLF